MSTPTRTPRRSWIEGGGAAPRRALSEAYAESANYLAREAALIGDRAAHTRTVAAVEGTARGKLAFRNFASLSAALRGLDSRSSMGDLAPFVGEGSGDVDLRHARIPVRPATGILRPKSRRLHLTRLTGGSAGGASVRTALPTERTRGLPGSRCR
jgi:hypothetical protein